MCDGRSTAHSGPQVARNRAGEREAVSLRERQIKGVPVAIMAQLFGGCGTEVIGLWCGAGHRDPVGLRLRPAAGATSAPCRIAPYRTLLSTAPPGAALTMGGEPAGLALGGAHQPAMTVTPERRSLFIETPEKPEQASGCGATRSHPIPQSARADLLRVLAVEAGWRHEPRSSRQLSFHCAAFEEHSENVRSPP